MEDFVEALRRDGTLARLERTAKEMRADAENGFEIGGGEGGEDDETATRKLLAYLDDDARGEVSVGDDDDGRGARGGAARADVERARDGAIGLDDVGIGGVGAHVFGKFGRGFAARVRDR